MKKVNKIIQKKNGFIRILIILILCVVPSTSSTFIYKELGNNYKKEETISRLFIEGKKLSTSINKSMDNIIKEIEIICQSNDINNLNKENIKKMLDYTRLVRREEIVDISMIDTNLNYIYGYNFNKENVADKEHVKEALAGKQSISGANFNYKMPFYEFAKPLYDDEKKVKAVILIDLSMESINDILKDGRLIDDSTEAYIVDKDGVFLTESRFDPDAVGKMKVDLKKMKQSIDYSKDVTYKDYRDINVHGNYFEVENTDWTIIFERDACKSEIDTSNMMRIGQYFALIQTIAITFFQKFYMKRDFKDKEEMINSLINENETEDNGKKR